MLRSGIAMKFEEACLGRGEQAGGRGSVRMPENGEIEKSLLVSPL